MPQIVITLHQIEKLIEQLPESEKVKLVNKLGAKTLTARWKLLFNRIDRRAKKHPISQKEINKLVEKTRQDLYDRSRR